MQKQNGGTKYSFVGRPDFHRIIAENPGADVIFVSREDGLVSMLANIGSRGAAHYLNVVGRCEAELGFEFLWETYHQGSKQFLPPGWIYTSSNNSDGIKDLRRLAQAVVRARCGKHTVEVLPPQEGA